MKVMEGPPDSWEQPSRPTAVSIGVFDGVHLGHREVIGSLVEHAAELGESLPGVVTFDRHPLEVIRPESAPRLISTLAERLGLLEALGIGFAAVLTFDDDMRSLSAEEFVETVLAARLRVRLILVGDGFRFGRNGEGTVDTLRRLGDHYGFAVRSVGLLAASDELISSTGIRRAVAAGDMEAARQMLGRPFVRQGVVVAGDERGRVIGFPTANLAVDADLLIPARGVYAGHALVDGERHDCVVNVGVRPTFDGSREVVEAHLLGFEGDLYGRTVGIEFLSRIRDEQRFDSIEQLTDQIERDVATARSILS